MKLDKIDFKILYELHYNARRSITELAKRVGISKQNVNYRLKKLIQDEVITGFMSVIDIHHLGYLTYRVYIRYRGVDKEREDEIIKYLNNREDVLWLVSLSGNWDLEVVFIARNFIHFNNIFKKVKEDVGSSFSKYNLSMSIVNYHLNRDYLLDKPHKEFASNYYGFEPKQEKLDNLDIKVLTELSKNCRQSNQEMGQKFGVSYHTIKERIKKLEEKKIISSHRIKLNLDKLNRLYYKALLFLNNPTKNQEKEIYYFCSQYSFIVYLVEVLGDWQLEVETEVANEKEFLSFMMDLRNKFPDLISDYYILQLTKEHKLNYLPIGDNIKA